MTSNEITHGSLREVAATNGKFVLVQTSKMEPQNTQNTQMNSCAGDAARDHTIISVHSQNGV